MNFLSDIVQLPFAMVGVIVLTILGAIFGIVWIMSMRYVLVGPNEVLVVSGRKRRILDPDKTTRTVGYRIIKGGGAFVWPVVEKAQRLSLELMTLEVTNPDVYTQTGIPLNVDAIAQIKVKGDDVSIATAAEQFLSKNSEEIQAVALRTLEGHLRAIVGTLSVEKIYQDREAFAQQIQEVAATDMAHMGLQIVSFTIRNVHDTQGYLEALGRPRIAEVKKLASIAQAEADRDSQIKVAEANQKAMEAKLVAETKISQSRASFEGQQAEYTAQANQKKAASDLAYELEKNKVAQLVKAEEMKVLIVQKEKDIEVWNKEVARKEEELNATVHKPAEAERFRLTQIANGEADAIRAKGKAEADAMSNRADAWKTYNQAAIMQMVLEKLPEIARAIAEPLSKTDRIVMISNGEGAGVGASKITQDVINIMSQLPPAVEALTKINLQDVLSKIPGIHVEAKAADKVDAEKKPTKEKE